MNKPLWAVAGIALLGTAGVAGVLVGASTGGEEEVVQQVDTPRPSASISATVAPTGATEASPTGTPGAHDTLWRWANVTVSVPAGSPIHLVRGGSAPPTLEMGLSKPHVIDPSYVILNALDGQTRVDHVARDDRPFFDQVLATLAVVPLDSLTAPWPYNGDPPADLRRERWGDVVYIFPDPSAGLQVGVGTAEGGIGDFISVENGRSLVFIQASTAAILEPDQIQPEDQALFAKYTDAVLHCSDTTAC